MSVTEAMARIENRIRSSRRLDEKAKKEMLDLLDSLWGEVSGMPEETGEDVASLAGFMDVSTYEATREDQDQELLDISITGLAKSVQKMEVTHPDLAGTVNRICALLSNMGI